MKTDRPVSFEQAIDLAEESMADRRCRCGQPLTIFLGLDPPLKLVAGKVCAPMEVGCETTFRALRENLEIGVFTNFILSAWFFREYFRLIKSHRHNQPEIIAWYRKPRTPGSI
jgi:hypothetical protein